MGKNRDQLMIIAAILEAVGSGASKTRVMYLSNLSFALLEKYLDSVVGSGFVRNEGSKYVLTDLGREFLGRYKRFHEQFLRVSKDLEAVGLERERLAQFTRKPNLFGVKGFENLE